MNTSKLSLAEFPATSQEEWRKAAEETLKGAPFEKKLLTKTREGIVLQPLYSAEDLCKAGAPETWPGLAPFLRGTLACGYRTTPWWISQEIPYGSPSEFRKAALSDLMRGQNALQIPLDVATRRCGNPESSHPTEVCQCGLSLTHLRDFSDALDGIFVDAIPVLCWAGASSLPLLSGYAAYAESKSLAVSSLQGGILGDPMTEWVRDGQLPFALDEAFDEMAQTVRWAGASDTKLRTVGVQGSFWADCGADAVQELALTLATGAEYLREMLRRDISIAEAAPRFVLGVSVGTQVFMEIAKLRALRLLWWNVVRAFGGDTEMCGQAFLHARSSMGNKTRLDPHTNMLRATAEGFAAVLGGVDSLHLSAFDEAVRPPDEFSRRIARNIHTILGEECGFADLADPSGGSWYVEVLTRELAERAWKKFQEIEDKGGMSNAIRAGTAQTDVSQSAAQRAQAVATRKEGMIGVNLFPNIHETPLPTNIPDYRKIHEERAAVVSARPQVPVSKTITTVAEAMDAWKSGASIEAIAAALGRREEVGDSIQRCRIFRPSEEFEKLRDRALRSAAANGGMPPKIWLANFGPPKQYKPRAEFSAGFLSPGGFLVEQGPGAKSVEDAVRDAVASGASVVVLCSTDDTYPEIVPQFVPALTAAIPGVHIILAGYPTEHLKAFEAAGVHRFIHIRANCLETNCELQDLLNIA